MQSEGDWVTHNSVALQLSNVMIRRLSEILTIAYANLKHCSWGLSSYKNVAWTLQMDPERWGTVTESRLKSIVFILFYLLPIPSAVNSHCYQPPTDINCCLSLQSKAVVCFPQVLQQSKVRGLCDTSWQPVGFISSCSKSYCTQLWPPWS